MKKFLCITMIAILCIVACVALVACNKPVDNNGLQMNTKYSYRIEGSDKSFEIRTYTFKSDGTGELYHYSSDKEKNYIQHFVYEFLNNDKSQIMLFKTKFENLNENQTGLNYANVWIAKMYVSENIIFGNDINGHEYIFKTYELTQKIENESGKGIYA